MRDGHPAYRCARAGYALTAKLHRSTSTASRPGHETFVIAGLDAAIHPLRKILAKKMDARVKPAHDEF
jgi:hypothetical protein